MTAYYNEIDPYAAQWLRNLIKAGHIAEGDVDERSIIDVRPEDVRGYNQCHFFAGIGGWSIALRQAGWPDERPVWTGSCPCQPFSGAGERAGFQDKRDLWPAWFELIRQRTPTVLFGEQVTAATIWLDRVFADLEDQNYAVAAAILPACAVDAPHRRDRLWFVADASSQGQQQIAGGPFSDEIQNEGRPSEQYHIAASVDKSLMADPTGSRPFSAAQTGIYCGEEGAGSRHVEFERQGYGALADADRCDGFWWSGPLQVGRNAVAGQATASSDVARTQWRIKPGISLLAHGVPARVAKLCAIGNAIVPQVAAEFIKATMEC